ncbi:MAG TPA: adenylyltransferase/cytidyltransferase family protein [Roseateles sp.]
MASQLPRPLVFTNGVFDLLHVGHVGCLETAARQGNCLVVALNGDASAAALGKTGWAGSRPLNTLADRTRIIGALACVSWVTWFDEATPAALLAALQPDVYVKGGDYDIEQLPETPLVRGWGGRVVIAPYQAGHSTTRLLARVQAS